MTLCYQETDSRLVVLLPWPSTEALTLIPPNETIGGRLDDPFIARHRDLFDSARRCLRRIDDCELRQRAQGVLDTIQQAMRTLTQYLLESRHLPPWQVSLVDDGSVLIEWAFPDLRLGFSVEPNPKDSSWYLVSTRALGGISASGYLSPGNLGHLIPWLLQLVLSLIPGESYLWNSQRTVSGASQTGTFSLLGAW